MLTLDRLFPDAQGEVDAADAYAHPAGAADPPGATGAAGPWLRANMVTSLDGAAALDGRVGSLTGPADQVLLQVLRSLCDVLLVGAGTVRAEGYGPVRVLPELQGRRGADQLTAPRLAVVSRSLDVDLASRAFTAAPERPLVVTCGAADPTRVAEAGEVADVLVAGESEVDLASVVAQLAERGLVRILSEGGPRLLGDLFAAGLVDELCLAVSPVVTGGAATRVTAGPPLGPPAAMTLAAVHERDGYLFLRHTR